MKYAKKCLCLLAALVMVLSLLPAQAVQGAGTGTAELGYGVEAGLDYQFDGTTVGPILADGEHVRWIDRIGNLPDYAATMYDWMVTNATIDGVLADPTLGQAMDGGYFYHIGTFSASVPYTYSDSAATAAKEAVVAHGDAAFDVIMDHCIAAYSAFDRDHPEVFWLSGVSSYTWKMTYSYDHDGAGSGTARYSMNVYFYLQMGSFDIRDSQYQDLAVLDTAIAQRDADVERILADCPVDAPVDEQLRYLNQVLTQTNAYNNSSPSPVDGAMDPWKSVSALQGRTGAEGPVCEGYAKALKVLCDALGIGCVLVEGDARSSTSTFGGAHMWNYVQVDGAWYAVDVTWNDPVVSGAKEDAVSGFECEDWFLLGSGTLVNTDLTFLQSHPVENVATYGGLDFNNGPSLAADAYVRPENYMDIAPYRSADGYTAPVREGYVFAGWYADADFTQPLAPSTTAGWAYAKFVDEQVLTVKYQITGGTNAQSTSTDLRLITSVDSVDYRQITFQVTFAGSTVSIDTRTVYSNIRADDMLISNAQEVFGAESVYFVTHSFTGMPQAAFDQTMVVTPCWITLDGTAVDGQARTFAISDSF